MKNSVLGYDFEITMFMNKEIVKRMGFIIWVDNFSLGLPGRATQANQSLVLYSYNNPSKIKSQIGYSIVGEF